MMIRTIEALSPEDAKRAIVEPARAQQVEFTEDALTALVNATHGYPYFIQMWAYRVWNAAAQSPIQSADVARVEQEVLNALDDSLFRVRFERMTPREREYARAMADIPGETVRSTDVAAVLHEKSQSLGPIRDNLIKKGMVFSPSHGDIAFFGAAVQ